MKQEMLLIKRLSQIPLHGRSFFQRRLQGGVKESGHIATGGLGLVHGKIRLLHQIIDALEITTEQGNADTGRAVMMNVVELVRLIERGQNFVRDRIPTPCDLV